MTVSQNSLDMKGAKISPRKKVTEIVPRRSSVTFFRARTGPEISTRYFEKLPCQNSKGSKTKASSVPM